MSGVSEREVKHTHTVGPWHYTTHREPIGETGDYDDVALVRTIGVAHPFPSWVAEVSDCLEQEANAALIAAAPDLLAACEEMLAGIENWNAAVAEIVDVSHLPKWPALDKVRAAIARATPA
jgi:hypothetical protein